MENKNKPWISIEINNHTEQKIKIQPTSEFDGIELYFNEIGNKHSKPLYLNKYEIEVLKLKLDELIKYIEM